MLWSLLKFLIFFGLVGALALGAGQLLETDAGLRISVAEMEFTLGPLQSVVALVVLLVSLWLLIKLAGLIVATLRFLNGDETALSRYFDRNRERRGYQALSDGLLALASGEGRLAMVKATRAERYLKRPDLTNLLSAQAAEVTGDRDKANKVYKEMLTDERTRFVGVRGLLKQKLAEGDTETALKLAEKAFALKPSHGATQDALLRLQAGNQDWTGARKTLGAKLRHGTLPRDVHKRRDAVLALSEAQEKLDAGDTKAAHDLVIEANRLSPDLVPAAALAARFYINEGKPRPAARVIKKAWAVAPHPELAAVFADIVPDETREARIKRFQPLIKTHAGHAETRMLETELFIAAEDFPAARKALGDLYESDPTTRALTLMAAIERGEGADDAVVRGWLTRALTASRGPQWVCDNCQSILAEWSPVCGNCDSVDTLSWTEPPASETVMPGGLQMLPLIVGKPTEDDAEILEIADPESDPAPDLDAEPEAEASTPEIVDAEELDPQPDEPAVADTEPEPSAQDAEATTENVPAEDDALDDVVRKASA